MNWEKDLCETTLLLDESKCRLNIKRMAAMAEKNQLLFRPHFKTHQSIEIGRWFRDVGVTAITVSSLKMASYFADDDWHDITVAIPVNTREKERINDLAKKIQLNLLVADTTSTALLSDIVSHPVNVWIKIDNGTNRTGILYHDVDKIQSIINLIDQNNLLHFEGFLTHAGDSYRCRNHEEIQKVHDLTKQYLLSLKLHFQSAHPDLKISIGDTPTCSIAKNFKGIDEIRPGNFVFYDTMQVQISACTPEEIAVALACPVVAKHDDRNEIIIIGGGIHLSKDYIFLPDGQKNYGEMVWLHKNGWSEPVEGCFLSKLSQEHGTLKVTDEVYSTIKTGDMVGVLPVHSCMTANLMASYTTKDGKTIDYFDLRKDYL